MKKEFRLIKTFVLTLLITTFGCGEDDGVIELTETTAQDLVLTIDENPSDGQTIGTIQATGDGSLSYSITSQNPDRALNINSTTGELKVADASLFNFEENPVITANISVEGAANSATAIATITLSNLDEISAEDLVVAIDENPINGQIIGTIVADGDGSLTFSITSQTSEGAISIDPDSGELTVADSAFFDFETNPVITANVSVTRAASTVETIATINLNNVNELRAEDLEVSIDENPSNGQYIGILNAEGNGSLNFTITSESSDGALAINSSTGALSASSGSLFNFESNPIVTAVISINNSEKTTTANVTINLNNVLEVGDYRDGGVVFWLDGNGGGLVCDTNDLNAGASIAWYNGSNINTGAVATAIGTGQANTNAIINSQGAGTYAATLCDNLSVNGFDDWYLPSLDEIEEIYKNRVMINATATANGGANLNTIFYWSSSQQDGNANNAWIQYFSNGTQGLNAKANMAWVRAVRTFTDI